MKVTVLSNQSLLDLSIQVYGSSEGVFMLAQENGLSVTDTLVPGQELLYSPDKAIDKRIVRYYRDNSIISATASNMDLDSRVFDNSFDLTFN